MAQRDRRPVQRSVVYPAPRQLLDGAALPLKMCDSFLRRSVVFIVAVVFFSGFFIGRNSSGDFRGGYHQARMMGPSQTAP
jgi:hypothetical protein